MADPTKLTYFVGPNLVYCTRTNSEVMVNLTISASNTTEEDIEITGITVTVPKGTGANDLTNGGMTPVSWQESTWRFKVLSDYFRISPVAPVTALKAGQSITFQLKNIKINTEPGTAVIEIEETSGDDNSKVFFPVNKIKSSLNVDVLTINPPEVKSGDPVTLTWQTTAAASVTLSPGDFPVLPVNGSKTLNPELTTTYTLTAKGEGPDIPVQVTVTVPPPTIVKFEPAEHEISAGDAVRLSWEVKNAGTITLSPGHEHESLPAIGSVEVKPAGDTVYILTAKNKALQTVDKHETVKIKPVVIRKFTATPNTGIVPGTTIELAWEIESAASAYILPDGIPLSAEQLRSGKIQVTVIRDTEYILTAQNSKGSKIAAVKAAVLSKGWQTVTTQAVFDKDTSRYALALNCRGKMWVISQFGPVYNSANGINWVKLGARTPWPMLDELSGVVFKDKMWIISGYASFPANRYLKDVWSSEDGETWAHVTDNAQWEGRKYHSCFTLGEKMFISGGMVNGGHDGLKNDVWSTTDGANWVKETDSAFKSPRGMHQTVVFNNRAWTLGGTTPAGVTAYEVYASSDGKTWELQTAKLSWEGLENLYLMTCCGASDGIYAAFNDLIYSPLQVHKMNNDGVWNKILIPESLRTTQCLWLDFKGFAWNFAGASKFIPNQNVIVYIA